MAPSKPPPSSGPPIGDDYGEEFGDPTNINQMPLPQNAHRTPSTPPPGMFGQGSPQLSHMGGQGPGQSQGTMSGMHPMPGPPQAQVAGVISQPTPYVSRSRIYAFVVDETGTPI